MHGLRQEILLPPVRREEQLLPGLRVSWAFTPHGPGFLTWVTHLISRISLPVSDRLRDCRARLLTKPPKKGAKSAPVDLTDP